MNPPVHPPEPDPPEPDRPVDRVDPVDEQLSAALDGAADPDFVAEPVAEAAVESRAQAIAAARDRLAIPPPPLDDLTRRRLVRTAVDAWAAPRRRRGWVERAMVPAAAVACILLVVLGGWALVTVNRPSSSKSASSKGASATTSPGLDLREVSDPAVLRRKVEAALRGAAPTLAPEVQPAPTGNATAKSPVLPCLSAVRVPKGAQPHPLGPATFHGAPAVVIVARDGPRTLIFVLATADCRVLSYQFLRQ